MGRMLFNNTSLRRSGRTTRNLIPGLPLLSNPSQAALTLVPGAHGLSADPAPDPSPWRACPWKVTGGVYVVSLQSQTPRQRGASITGPRHYLPRRGTCR